MQIRINLWKNVLKEMNSLPTLNVVKAKNRLLLKSVSKRGTSHLYTKNVSTRCKSKKPLRNKRNGRQIN